MSAPVGPGLLAGAMPLRILSGTRVSKEAAHQRSVDPPAAVLEEVRGDGRDECGRGDNHDGEHAAVAEKRQAQRAEQGARRVEDVTGLPRVQAKRLEAVMKVEQVGGCDGGLVPA